VREEEIAAQADAVVREEEIAAQADAVVREEEMAGPADAVVREEETTAPADAVVRKEEITPHADEAAAAAESADHGRETASPTKAEDAAQLAEEPPQARDDAQVKAILEAVVYVTDEPLSAQQIAAALGQPLDKVKRALDELVAEYAKPEHGLSIREVAAGYKMATKAEHHEAVRVFVKRLTPPLKLSLAALETLAVIAYKQPVTAPEIMEIRGVQGAGVLKTLLDRKLISESGRKNVVGKPILYKTTREFLVQFGLKDVHELPTVKEFEELGRMEIVEPEAPAAGDPPQTAPAETVAAESTEAPAEG
jgi:segregation and condensation protein B